MLISKNIYLTTVSGRIQEEAKQIANKEGAKIFLNTVVYDPLKSDLPLKFTDYYLRSHLLTCYQQDVFWFGSSSGKVSRRLENCHIKIYLYYVTAF